VHAGTLHAVLHQVAASSFHHAGGNRISQAPTGLSLRALARSGLSENKQAPTGPSGTCLAPLWGASQSHGLWPWSVTPCSTAIRPMKVRFIPPHVHLAARKGRCGPCRSRESSPPWLGSAAWHSLCNKQIVKWDETASVFDAQKRGPRASGCERRTRPLSSIRGDDSPTERRAKRCDCRPSSNTSKSKWVRS
jgi:hypothetical protein